MSRRTTLLLALALVLTTLLTPLAPLALAGNHWQAPVKGAAPSGNHWQFVPEEPLGRGLHLLPATPRHDYGNLTPLHIDSTHTITLPAAVDLSKYDMPVGDQAYIGSCTSWSSAYSLAGWWATYEKLPVTAFAPMYLYHQVNGGADNGAYVPDNLVAGQNGLLPMGAYSQGNYDWSTAPTGAEMAQAAHIRMVGGIVTYQKPLGGDYYGDQGAQAELSRRDAMDFVRYSLEVALAHYGPQVLSLAVMTNFDNATPQTAYLYDDTKAADLLGYHALLAVKYDSAGVWVENQWGTGWGLNGYAELSWDYVLDNVSEADGISGVIEAPGSHVVVTTGIPTLSTQVVTDGIPLATPTLTAGHEVVLRARAFRPGEIVRLYIDGSYRQYLTVVEDGTASTEIYLHPATHEGPHNVHLVPGLHTILLRGERGDYAWTTLRTA